MVQVVTAHHIKPLAEETHSLVEDLKTPARSASRSIHIPTLLAGVIRDHGLASLPRIISDAEGSPAYLSFWKDGCFTVRPALSPNCELKRGAVDEVLLAPTRSHALVPSDLPTIADDPRAWAFYGAASDMLFWRQKLLVIERDLLVRLDGTADPLREYIAQMAPLYAQCASDVECHRMNDCDGPSAGRRLRHARGVYDHDVRSSALVDILSIPGFRYEKKSPEWWQTQVTRASDAVTKIGVTALAAGFMTISRDVSVPVSGQMLAWLVGHEFRSHDPKTGRLLSDIDIKSPVPSEDVFALLQLVKNARKHALGDTNLRTVDEPEARYFIVTDHGKGVREGDGRPMLSVHLTKIFGRYSSDGDDGKGLSFVHHIVRQRRQGAIGVVSITDEAGRNDVFLSKMPRDVSIRAKELMDEDLPASGSRFLLALPHRGV